MMRCSSMFLLRDLNLKVITETRESFTSRLIDLKQGVGPPRPTIRASSVDAHNPCGCGCW